MGKRSRKTPTLLDQLRDHTRNSGILPIEVARQLGIDRAALSRFLAGKASLRPENLNALAEMLGLQLCKRRCDHG